MIYIVHYILYIYINYFFVLFLVFGFSISSVIFKELLTVVKNRKWVTKRSS